MAVKLCIRGKEASNLELNAQASRINEILDTLPEDERVKAEYTIDCLTGWASFDDTPYYINAIR